MTQINPYRRRFLRQLLAGAPLPAFFGTQFMGAFNDNLFKNALIVWLEHWMRIRNQ